MEAIQRSCELWAHDKGSCELSTSDGKSTSKSTHARASALRRLPGISAEQEEQSLDTDPAAGGVPDSSSRGAKSVLSYGALSRKSAKQWLDRLRQKELSNPDKIIPSAEQIVALNMVIERCLQEQVDEIRDEQPRSEPITGLLHGVPGAGKSQTLLWIRDFFERVCGWKHGTEFVYLASQNTMSFHVGGFTLHSYGDIPFAKKDGKTANVKKDDRKDINKKTVKYQSLRWIFIDEASTASVQILAELEYNLRRCTRQQNTWKLRFESADGDCDERRWGGRNLVYCGDF